MQSFILSPKDAAARHKVYQKVDKMRELKNKTMPHFAGPDGARSFSMYIDDSERILNGYVMSRDAQDKEPWQSNMLDNITRAKLRAIATSVGLRKPAMRCTATNKSGMKSYVHAEIGKSIVYNTFSESNPALHNFYMLWQMMAHGVIFVHEGYKTGGAKMTRVKSFDSRTGEIETETKYVELSGRPCSVIINPQDFFWWDFYISDIQQQPCLAWVQHYTYRQLELEFSEYKNFKYVKDKKGVAQFTNLQETLYYKKWSDRVDQDDDYELVRYYSKEDDQYEIWCNGVPLFRGPLIWGDTDKYYPFAKEISEPFANTNFFVGMSFPALLEAYQDTKQSIINSLVDKLYRSVDPAWLIGLQNKDLLDVESQFEGSDGRYYVPDVNAVKPIPIQGINQAELTMLQVIDRGLDSLSIDRAQQGLQSTGAKTAKEIAVADQRARELKGMLYLFLENLWLQLTRIRTRNILAHYLKDKAASKERRDQIITINDFRFYTGEVGILDIHVATNRNSLLTQTDIEAREMAAQQQGLVYKIVSVTQSFIDDYTLDFTIVPESIHEQDRIKKEQDLDSEVNWLATFNPELLIANKDYYTRKKLGMTGTDMEDLQPPAPVPTPAPGMPAPAAPGASGTALPPTQPAMPQPAL